MPHSTDLPPSQPTEAPPTELLEQHRRDIEALDRRILHLICERLELARQIGNLKVACGVPLRNFEVEAQVHGRLAKVCDDLGLDPELGRGLARFLIEKAVEEQASLMDSVYHGDHLEALVVGGKGGMGRWMARFLAGQGHRVRVYDPAPDTTPYEEATSLPGAAVRAHLIILAVPMSVCPEVLDELAEIRPGGVVAEMCSLKSHLSSQLDSLRARGLRVISFHPLFGPDVRMLSGRTIVFCSGGEANDRRLLSGLFARTSVSMVEMDLAEHDRRMALILGLTHLSNLVFARALSHSGVTASEMAEVAGVTFTKQLATTREVTDENPELYFQIQQLNPSTPETAGWLVQAVEEFAATVAGADAVAFAELMRGCRDYLANGHA
jgi:chorismate mutase/prephenate dehydrogenase